MCSAEKKEKKKEKRKKGDLMLLQIDFDSLQILQYRKKLTNRFRMPTTLGGYIDTYLNCNHTILIF